MWCSTHAHTELHWAGQLHNIFAKRAHLDVTNQSYRERIWRKRDRAAVMIKNVKDSAGEDLLFVILFDLLYAILSCFCD